MPLKRRGTQKRSPVGVILAVVGALGVALALVVVFDSTPAPIDRSALPNIDEEHAAQVELEQIRATDIARDDSAVAKKRAELEKGLVEAEAYHLERMKARTPQRFGDVLGRWRELIGKAAGTDYASYVQTRIDRVADARDEAAVAAFAATRKEAQDRAAFGLWGECFAAIDRFPDVYREAPVYEKLTALRQHYKREQKRYEQVSVRILADFGPEPDKLERIRLLHKQNVHMRGGHVKLLQNYSSALVFGFRVAKVPRPLYLRVLHLSSRHKGRHLSPITLSINGKIVVGEWTPSERGWHTTRWDVADYVRVGDNEIVWQLGDARTHYWLKRFEISDWKP